jgi:hypothetical protein
MNSKDKAIQLVDKFTETIFESGCTVSKPMIKQCALLCMEEILDGYRKILPSSRVYWEQVKTEINLL